MYTCRDKDTARRLAIVFKPINNYTCTKYVRMMIWLAHSFEFKCNIYYLE